jgi:hypothetical protein
MKEFVVTKVKTSWDNEKHCVKYLSNTSIEKHNNIPSAFRSAMYLDEDVRMCYVRPTDEYRTTSFIVVEMKYEEDVSHHFVQSAGIRYAQSVNEIFMQYEHRVLNSVNPSIVLIRPATQEEAEYYEETFCDEYV